MKEAKIKVVLLSHTQDPERTIVSAIRQCYSRVSGKELWDKVTDDQKERLIKQIISSGHTSTIEHASFTFAIEGFSRIVSSHLIRHRIASYSQQSQRYSVEKDFKYILPKTIAQSEKTKKIYLDLMQHTGECYDQLIVAGVPAEDARMALPNSCETKIVVTMNARSLFNFFQERLCERAQWEMQELALLMLKECRKVAPNVFKYVGPTCVTEKICWQGKMNCGRPKRNKNIELRKRG